MVDAYEINIPQGGLEGGPREGAGGVYGGWMLILVGYLSPGGYNTITLYTLSPPPTPLGITHQY